MTLAANPLRLDFQRSVYLLNGLNIGMPMIPDPTTDTLPVVIDDDGLVVTYSNNTGSTPPRNFSICNNEAVITALMELWNTGEFLWIQNIKYLAFGDVEENPNQWDGLTAFALAHPVAPGYGQGGQQISANNSIPVPELAHHLISTMGSAADGPEKTLLIGAADIIPEPDFVIQTVWMMSGGNLYQSFNGSMTETVPVAFETTAGGYDPDFTFIDFFGLHESNGTNKRVTWAGVFDATGIDPGDLPEYSTPGFYPFPVPFGAPHILLPWVGA